MTDVGQEEGEEDIVRRLADLSRSSFVAHRDAVAALPAIRPLGPRAVLEWLATADALFGHDREAGKAFIRGSGAVARVWGGTSPWCIAARRFCAWSNCGPAVQAFMNALPDAAALPTQDTVRWMEIGFSWCSRHMDSGRAYFETPLGMLAAGGGLHDIEQLLEPAVGLWREHGLSLACYLPGALRVRTLLGTPGARSWARRGGDILKSGRRRGEAFFALASEESRALLLEHLPGFRILEHERLLQLLLVAWFGEPFDLHASDWMPGNVPAIIETDGRALFLPAVFPDREQTLLSVWHAAGHLLLDTFDRTAIEELFQAAGCPYPPLDPDQAITWDALLRPYGEDLPRFQVLFDLCEDLRIDARLAARIPGYLRRLEALPDGEMIAPAAPYRNFVRKAWRALLGDDAPDPRLVPLFSPDARVRDAFSVARVLLGSDDFPRLAPDERMAAYPPAHGPNVTRPVYPRAPRAKEYQYPIDQDSADARLAECRAVSEQSPRDAQGDDHDLNIDREDTAGAGGRVGVGLPQPARVTGRGRMRAPGDEGYAYPEWDYRGRQLRARWTRVHERSLDDRDLPEVERILAQHGQTLRRLRRAIEVHKPVRLAPYRRQLEGETLDLDAAVDFVALRRAGLGPRPEIYCQQRPQRRDIAVLLLVDLSTSIMERLADGSRIVDRIRAALVLFSESLQEIGDPYAIAGFASKYRDQVSYYAIKEFDQPLDRDVRAILGGLSGRLATRMGAAVRHALARFESRSQRRLLLLLSDGRPADYDDGGDSRYLEEDTRVAIKGCVDQGVHPFCITLDPRGGDYLQRVFGQGHYLVVDRLDDLPARLSEIYLRLRAA
ncbi:MAG: hypothetical protein ACYCRH_11090 [Acidiferrobacteraceae bacterium]